MGGKGGTTRIYARIDEICPCISRLSFWLSGFSKVCIIMYASNAMLVILPLRVPEKVLFQFRTSREWDFGY
jgi:hypothetical protein